MHKIFVIMSDAGYFVCPNFFLLQWVMWVTLGEKVLEEAHILQTEYGDLVVRLMGDLRERGIFAFQSCLDAMPTRWLCLLALDAPPLAVVTSPATLRVSPPLQSRLGRSLSSNLRVHAIRARCGCFFAGGGV